MSDDLIHLRTARAVDTPALSLVGGATFLESFAGVIDGGAIVAHCNGEHSQAAYARYLDRGAQVWLAEAQPGAAPVGYAMLTTPDLPGAAENDIELKRIYVLSRYYGTGLAARLLDTAIAAASGKARLLLGVYKGNERAIGFYRKHGFDIIGERQFTVGSKTYEDHVFALTLTN